MTEEDIPVIRRLWRRFDIGDLVDIQRLPGRSRRVYMCVSGRGRDVLVRLAEPGRARFEMEAAAVARCRAAGIPAPAVLYVGTEPRGAGGDDAVAVSVQERAVGETLSRHVRHHGPRAVAAAGEVLVRIHLVATSGFGPVDSTLHAPANRLGDWFVDGLAGQLADARRIRPEAGLVLDHAMSLLTAHRAFLDSCTGPGLVHGDFSPDNVLVDDAGQVTAVVDWEAAKSGPPEMDVGWWDCFFDSPLTPAHRLVEGYERHARFDPERLVTLRHLTVLRIMIGYFSWARSVGESRGMAKAVERLGEEVRTAHVWSAATVR